MKLETRKQNTGALHERIPTKRPLPRGLAVMGGALALLVLVCLIAALQPTKTYVISDGTRLERITLSSGGEEEALRKMGFQNVTILERREDEDTIYLSVEEVFDVSIRTTEGVFTVRSKSGTVEEILEQNGVALGAEDLVTPERDTWVKKNSEIVVVRVTHEQATETEPIPFTVDVRENPQMLKGQQRITQYGRAGEKQLRYRVTLHDGQEAERELLSERETASPVNCVIEKGMREPQTAQEQREVEEQTIQPSKTVLQNTAPPAAETDSNGLSTEGRSQVWSVPAGITDDTANKIITAGDGSSFEYTAVVEVKATAYHRIEDGGEVTASGTITRYGTVAVDPTVIPLGSSVYVVSNGGDQSWSYGPGLAEDTGGLIKGARIDLFFMTGSEADQFGVRPAKVYILKD